MSLTVQNKYSFGYTMEYLNNNKGLLPVENDSIWDSNVAASKDKVVTKPTQNIPETQAQKDAKAGLQSDLDSFKAAGVSVTWSGNTCTLSHNGKTATITLNAAGEPEFAGDMEYMQNYLEQASPGEKEASQKYENFVKGFQDKGYELADQKIKKIKINGKETSVVECTFKSSSGETSVAYLDNDGNQVKPD